MKLLCRSDFNNHCNAYPNIISRFKPDVTMAQTGYYSAVQNILALTNSVTTKEFAQLSTDESRFEFVASLDYVDSSFGDMKTMPSINGSKKSTSEAEKFRSRGNDFYKDGDIKEALSCYNKCVIYAPTPKSVFLGSASPGHRHLNGASEPISNGVEPGSGESLGGKESHVKIESEHAHSSSSELALGFGNRSAVLLQMKKHKECIEDIELALKYGYPEDLKYKLLDRKGRCLMELGKFKEAGVVFQSLREILDSTKLNLAQKTTIKASIEKKIEECASSDEIPQKEARALIEVPTLSGPASERYPNASDAFEVRHNQEYGRYGVAAKDVRIGDVILVESPYVCVLNQDMFDIRCYHCFRSLTVFIPCSSCIRVKYCSEECRRNSWSSHHSIECHCIEALLSSGTGSLSQLAVRIAITTGLQRMLKVKRNPKTDADEAQHSLFINADGVYLGGFASLYCLLSHSDKRSTADLIQYSILAVWITKILAKIGFFSDPGVAENNAYTIIGGMILRFLQIISCNGVEITEMRIGDNLQKCDPYGIGLGLYSTVSLINHSCDPVIDLIFYHDKCVVRAIQNIQAGQDLVIDYGYLYYTTHKQQRHLALRSQYFFDCQCIPCVFDWPIKEKMKCDIPLLKCQGCGEGLPQMGMDVVSKPQCVNCNKVYDRMAVLEELYHSQTKAEQAMQEARKFHIQKAMAVIESHVTLLANHVVQPWKEYITSVSTLKQYYRMLGNRRRR